MEAFKRYFGWLWGRGVERQATTGESAARHAELRDYLKLIGVFVRRHVPLKGIAACTCKVRESWAHGSR